MEQEKTSKQKISEDKIYSFSAGRIYSVKHILLGTILGGSLATGYFIAQNFKEFNDSGKEKITWIISILFALLIFGYIFYLGGFSKAFFPLFSPDGFPFEFLPFIFLIIVYILVNSYQENRLFSHIKNGGQFHSYWRVIGISLVFLFINIAVFYGMTFLTKTTEKIRLYGSIENEVKYYEGNIEASEIDDFARALKQVGYFTEQQKSFVHIQKTDKTYIISIGLAKPDSLDKESLEKYKSMRKALEKEFSGNKIIFQFVFNHIDNVIKRLE